MNNNDRKKLERLHACLKIPKYACGTQSTTVKGLASCSKDCAFAIPAAMDALYAIATGEEWEVEASLKELEEWYKQRKAEDWS